MLAGLPMGVSLNLELFPVLYSGHSEVGTLGVIALTCTENNMVVH